MVYPFPRERPPAKIGTRSKSSIFFDLTAFTQRKLYFPLLALGADVYEADFIDLIGSFLRRGLH